MKRLSIEAECDKKSSLDNMDMSRLKHTIGEDDTELLLSEMDWDSDTPVSVTVMSKTELHAVTNGREYKIFVGKPAYDKGKKDHPALGMAEIVRGIDNDYYVGKLDI